MDFFQTLFRYLIYVLLFLYALLHIAYHTTTRPIPYERWEPRLTGTMDLCLIAYCSAVFLDPTTRSGKAIAAIFVLSWLIGRNLHYVRAYLARSPASPSG